MIARNTKEFLKILAGIIIGIAIAICVILMIANRNSVDRDIFYGDVIDKALVEYKEIK